MIFNPVIVGGSAKLPELTDPGTAAELLAPKQLIDAGGNILTGTMPEVEQATPSIAVSAAGLITASAVQEAGHVAGGTKSATQQLAVKTSSDLTASGATVTAPAGYYASAASKSVATATQATPSITVSSAGLITASATQTAGYVAAGTKSATKQLTTKAAATITPSTVNQTIASGRYLTGTQTIKGDANLLAENIKSGVSIFGVAGTLSGVKMKVYAHSQNYVTLSPSSKQLSVVFNELTSANKILFAHLLLNSITLSGTKYILPALIFSNELLWDDGIASVYSYLMRPSSSSRIVTTSLTKVSNSGNTFTVSCSYSFDEVDIGEDYDCVVVYE